MIDTIVSVIVVIETIITVMIMIGVVIRKNFLAGRGCDDASRATLSGLPAGRVHVTLYISYYGIFPLFH